ncbi:LysR family transcriptional regulator [Vitiosangium sp. GDMCC 1.1324]|uniref:LysR family transcriptional regulator n=1 Tax=Vitiosangium sp. (strain GDMCC 1.1324) TaxID=2138576 RepID=UPI000D3A4152|nr:LysR family transcriptional regulator [Vitiosangium sp. GDMCC 1.1324]PTL84163.1 LysR family transcriptional regulator [Vitiosangium sp. GDMCC 1.1324]
MLPLDSLTDMTVFVRVVAAGSLSAAARELDMSLAVVSKRLARLEAQLGVRLVNRTTRRLSLTQEGNEFHARAVRILDEVEDAAESVGGHGRKARGLLRVTATAAFAQRQISPRLSRFHALHPDVKVHLLVSDTVVDLVQHGIDLAIREAVLPDSNLIVRRLAPNYRTLCASPEYAARHGEPREPAELLQHQCIVFGEPPMTVWRLSRPDAEPVAVEVGGSVLANDGEVAHAAALSGSGIILKSIWHVGDDLDAGRLVRLMPQWRVAAAPIQAVHPAGRHLAAKVRCFVEFLAAELQSAYRWGT